MLRHVVVPVPSSWYGAGMLRPHGNRLLVDLAQLLADAAAYRKHL
ncbi:MAG: hypothetical protein ACK55Z_05145 [bacterium]